jgi:hypothetical protein
LKNVPKSCNAYTGCVGYKIVGAVIKGSKKTLDRLFYMIKAP